MRRASELERKQERAEVWEKRAKLLGLGWRHLMGWGWGRQPGWDLAAEELQSASEESQKELDPEARVTECASVNATPASSLLFQHTHKGWV